MIRLNSVPGSLWKTHRNSESLWRNKDAPFRKLGLLRKCCVAILQDFQTPHTTQILQTLNNVTVLTEPHDFPNSIFLEPRPFLRLPSRQRLPPHPPLPILFPPPSTSPHWVSLGIHLLRLFGKNCTRTAPPWCPRRNSTLLLNHFIGILCTVCLEFSKHSIPLIVRDVLRFNDMNDSCEVSIALLNLILTTFYDHSWSKAFETFRISAQNFRTATRGEKVNKSNK